MFSCISTKRWRVKLCIEFVLPHEILVGVFSLSIHLMFRSSHVVSSICRHIPFFFFKYFSFARPSIIVLKLLSICECECKSLTLYMNLFVCVFETSHLIHLHASLLIAFQPNHTVSRLDLHSRELTKSTR